MSAPMDYGVYIHVPFCRRKCPYCHFFVTRFKPAETEPFVSALSREIRTRLPHAPGRLCSIYFGGGTPALLEPLQIRRLVQQLLSLGPVAPDLEITLEANPEDLSGALAASFLEAGINRFSIGVQSLQDAELAQLGRHHTAQQAMEVIAACAAQGCTRISIDLMFDLPKQTLADWEDTLAQALRLPIQHMSLYNLTIEPHTSFWRRREVLQSQQPSEELSAKMLEAACLQLKSAGWCRYELSAFSLPQHEAVHNRGYWLGRPFLGFGPSAWSDWGMRRLRNCCNLPLWMSHVNGGQSAIDCEDVLEGEALQRERLVIQLRLREGIEWVTWSQRWGEPSAALLADVEHLASIGLLETSEKGVMLSPQGKLLYDSVASELISPGPPLHTVAACPGIGCTA